MLPINNIRTVTTPNGANSSPGSINESAMISPIMIVRPIIIDMIIPIAPLTLAAFWETFIIHPINAIIPVTNPVASKMVPVLSASISLIWAIARLIIRSDDAIIAIATPVLSIALFSGIIFAKNNHAPTNTPIPAITVTAWLNVFSLAICVRLSIAIVITYIAPAIAAITTPNAERPLPSIPAITVIPATVALRATKPSL